MTSKLEVINRALRFLGERPITNPDAPDTPAGKHIVATFTPSRREVIRRYPWNFAEIWVEVDITTAPAFGYENAYVLPADFLRLLFVGDPEYDDKNYRLLTQGAPDYRRVIAINNGAASTLKIGYSADIELLSLWDPLALKVLALWMALDAARSITGQADHVKTLNSLLSEELKDAVGVDGQEQSIRLHKFSDVQRARDLAGFDVGVGWFTNVDYS